MTFTQALPDPALDAREPVARLLGHEMAAHSRAIVHRWPAAHHDEPDGVHAMRVSTRRLRSLLATARPFLDRDVTEPVREELGWLIDVLGEARDAEVQSARIREAVAALVSERADLDWEADHVVPALLAPLQGQHRVALDTVRDSLESARYAELVERLEMLGTAPPWTSRARDQIADAYRRRVRRELRRLDRRISTAGEADLGPDERAAALHDARKAARRARYALEPLRPVYGKRAKKLVTRLKSLQSRLGELQDTVITREYLHQLVHSHDPSVDPAVALVAGALIEREAAHADAFDGAALHAWHRVTRAKPLR